MKRMLLAIMAVAVAISFSAPSFAGDTDKPKEEKKGKKETHMIYAGEGDKKEEKKKEKK
jgi:hypothetical protein